MGYVSDDVTASKFATEVLVSVSLHFKLVLFGQFLLSLAKITVETLSDSLLFLARRVCEVMLDLSGGGVDDPRISHLRSSCASIGPTQVISKFFSVMSGSKHISCKERGTLVR